MATDGGVLWLLMSLLEDILSAIVRISIVDALREYRTQERLGETFCWWAHEKWCEMDGVT